MNESAAQSEKTNSSIFRGGRWMKWLLSAFMFVLLLPICVYITARIYKTEIIEVINREISSRYHAQIHFEDVDMSLFQTFPRTSLSLTNLSVKNALAADSILLMSEKIYLTLDIISLVIHDKVVFDGIRIDRAELNLTKYQNGKSNWDIFSSQNDSTTIAIEDFILTDFRFIYKHHESQWLSDIAIDQAELNGNIMSPQSNFNLDVSFKMDSLMSSGTSYTTNVPVRWRAKDIRRQGERIQCTASSISVGEVNGTVDIEYNFQKLGRSLLSFETSETQLGDLIAALPKHYITQLKDYSLVGECDLNLNLNFGSDAKTLSGNFQLRDGSFSSTNGGELSSLFTDIQFGSDRGGFCEIKKCTATTDGGKLEINGGLNFAKSGYFKGTFAYEGNLKELIGLSPAAQEYQITGESSINANLEGVLFDSNSKLKPSMTSGSGSIDIRNTRAFIPALNSPAEQIQMHADVYSGGVNINSLEFTLNGSHFNASGNVKTPLDAFSKQGLLHIENLNIQADQIRIEDWAVENQSRADSSASENDISSAAYSLQGIFNCNKITRAGVQLKDFTCDFDVAPSAIQFNTLRAGIADGAIEGNCTQRANQFDGRFSFNNVDIQQLFLQTENFGQSKITSENISGRLNGTASISGKIADGNLISNDLLLETSITVRNGRLKNYTPLIELVDFVQENKMLSVFVNEDELRKKLTDVEFQDLTNTLYVQEGQIIIPEMKIESNAFDITVRGKQSLEGAIDYNIGLNIFQVIQNRERVAAKGRNNIFIHMFGTIEQPRFEVEKELIKLPEIKLPQFLKEREESVVPAPESYEEKNNPDTMATKKTKLPSLIKNKEGETRKWLREKN